MNNQGLAVMDAVSSDEKIKLEDSGLSKREWNELMTAFNIKDKLV